MRRNLWVVLGLVLIVLLLAAAFIFLDFRIVRARLATESIASTYTFSISDELPLPLEQELDLYVDAPAQMREAFVAALRERLRGNPYIGSINLREGTPVEAANSVLVVVLREPASLFWTPFYTSTEAVVNAAYASDGAVDWIDEEPVVLESTDPPVPVARTRAEHQFDGSAFGLISGPGYASYLAGEVAQAVNQSLEQQLGGAGR